MNETQNTKLLSDATQDELIDALGALWAKDYLDATTEPTEAAEYAHSVMYGDGDWFDDDNRDQQGELWEAVHSAFIHALVAHPEVAALVAKMEADDEANRPAIDWTARLDHARSELAKAEADRIKFPKDKCQDSRVANCLAFLRSEVSRAADAGFDADGTPSF